MTNSSHATLTTPPTLGVDCIIPEGVRFGERVSVGSRVVIAGPDVTIGDDVVISAASVIGNDITIGQGSIIRPGAVILQSVPPNAIMQGNPAQIVGYAQGPGGVGERPTRLFDYSLMAGVKAPARLELDVGDAALHLMRRVVDARGALTVGEVSSELPFSPERYFVVYDVPSSELRGEHAHKECAQFLICVHGACRLMMDDGVRRCEVTLDRPELGVYMPPLIWGTQYRYSNDAVLMVFASHKYDPNDYLRHYDGFLTFLKQAS